MWSRVIQAVFLSLCSQKCTSWKAFACLSFSVRQLCGFFRDPPLAFGPHAFLSRHDLAGLLHQICSSAVPKAVPPVAFDGGSLRMQASLGQVLSKPLHPYFVQAQLTPCSSPRWGASSHVPSASSLGTLGSSRQLPPE